MLHWPKDYSYISYVGFLKIFLSTRKIEGYKLVMVAHEPFLFHSSLAHRGSHPVALHFLSVHVIISWTFVWLVREALWDESSLQASFSSPACREVEWERVGTFLGWGLFNRSFEIVTSNQGIIYIEVSIFARYIFTEICYFLSQE